jgi:hypothetical protein
MSISWQAQAIATVVSVLLVGSDTVPFVVATMLMSTAVAFGVDDPAHEVTAPAPVSLLRRRLVRIAVVLAPTAAIWGTLAATRGADSTVEAWALVAMFCGLTGLSLGIAALLAQTSHGRSGQIAAPTVFVLLIISSVMTPQWRPMPLGDVPGGWSQIYLRWGLVAVVGCALLLHASRNPARR